MLYTKESGFNKERVTEIFGNIVLFFFIAGIYIVCGFLSFINIYDNLTIKAGRLDFFDYAGAIVFSIPVVIITLGIIYKFYRCAVVRSLKNKA